MSLLSLIAVFLLEQLQPLPYRRLVAGPVRSLADFVEARLNAGEYRHGILGWLVTVLLPVLLTAAVYFGLAEISPILALVFNIAVLYLTMGFRQFSHEYTEIQLALRLGELERARELLARWQGRPVSALGSGEVAALAIEHALAASHRHVFAVLLWFVLLPGPCGAVLYRFAFLVARRWSETEIRDRGDFFKFPQQAFAIIDWLPLRATAAAFAIVGDFEDAVYCWRTQAAEWPDRELGIVLASGAGALGVQLGMPLVDGGGLADRSELGVGEPADADFMQSAVGLVWRATVLWILLLFLLGLATLVG